MVPSCSRERAGLDVLVRVTCGSLYSPGSSNVGSVRKRNPAISMSAVGPPMRVILGVLVFTTSLVSERSEFRDLRSVWRHHNLYVKRVICPKFIGQTKDDLEHRLSVGFKEPEPSSANPRLAIQSNLWGNE